MASYEPEYDLNKDGKINAGDFAIFAQHYGKTAPFTDDMSAKCDFNHDGIVNDADYELFQEHYFTEGNPRPWLWPLIIGGLLVGMVLIKTKGRKN